LIRKPIESGLKVNLGNGTNLKLKGFVLSVGVSLSIDERKENELASASLCLHSDTGRRELKGGRWFRDGTEARVGKVGRDWGKAGSSVPERQSEQNQQERQECPGSSRLHDINF